MNPSHEQIERAAYLRWERRGTRHGNDRDDWAAAEKDLRFALNYRWLARRTLGPVAEAGPRPPRRPRCRYCERSAPSVAFSARPIALPGGGWLASDDECDDCRESWESLAGPFGAFVRPFLLEAPKPAASVPIPALKALVRLGLALVPGSELHHFGDTIEWAANPDHVRDARTAAANGLGCHVYLTPEPLPTAFLSLARRSDDDAPYPYMLTFLGVGRAVFQTHLPYCPRDEEIESDRTPSGPVVSMSLGRAEGLRESAVMFLPVESGRERVSRQPQAEFRHETTRSASPTSG